jgi:RNA polymerase sigma-70 factor, ECF subfamily
MTAIATFDHHRPTTDLILAEEGFLHRLAWSVSHRHADANDLVQETLLRAYAARERFVIGTSIRAWLATILRRLHLTNAATQRRRATSTDTDADEPLQRIGGITEYFGMTSRTRWATVLEYVDDDMKNAIALLPAIYRQPLLMYTIDGLSYAEIAARLAIPIGTVMSRIHRARPPLRAAVARPWRPRAAGIAAAL